MKRKSDLYFLIVFLSSIIVFCSCRNKIIITKNYIYSTSWENGEYQGFKIAKIKIVDTTVSVFDKNFNPNDLAKYIVDSSFCFGVVSTVETRTKKEKIFFDKTYKDLQWFKCLNGFDRIHQIGLLSNNTWYIIKGLHGTEDFFVYIDNESIAHTYSLGPTNW